MMRPAHVCLAFLLLGCNEPSRIGTSGPPINSGRPGAGGQPSGGAPGTGGSAGAAPGGAAGGSAGSPVVAPGVPVDAGQSTPVDGAGTPAPPPLADAASGGPLPGAPRPTRLVVLGDSIAACSNIGSKQDPGCSPYKLYQHVKASYAPALVYENLAIGGADTQDVPGRETGQIAAAPGHALVLIYVGGNDLRRYLLADDAAAENGYRMTLPQVQEAWKKTFAALADRTKFPDGVTVLMNNQYNPFDGCSAFPYFLSSKKHQLLASYNMELAAIATANGALLTDQHTPYLGHGHHYNVRSCPHYQAGAAPFMGDLIHPNRAGHENLFQQWKKLVDRLYGV